MQIIATFLVSGLFYKKITCYMEWRELEKLSQKHLMYEDKCKKNNRKKGYDYFDYRGYLYDYSKCEFIRIFPG